MSGHPVDALSIVDVEHRYVEDPVLRGLSLGIRSGQSVAVMGPSGCGKSTLLLLAAGIISPSAGRVLVAGRDLAALGENGRACVRRTDIGFVFQFSELISELSVVENVAIAGELSGMNRRQAADAADLLLKKVDVDAVGSRKPGSISGGQAQRAAIARAIVHKPRIVLADEPTGALDSANGELALNMLLGLTKESGSAILLATHDMDIAKRCDRLIELKDGIIRDDDCVSS